MSTSHQELTKFIYEAAYKAMVQLLLREQVSVTEAAQFMLELEQFINNYFQRGD